MISAQSTLRIGVILLALTASLNALATPADSVYEEVLASVDVKGFDEAYRDQTRSLASGKIIYITAPDVEFNAHWKKRHRYQFTSYEQKKFVARYSKLLTNALTRKLSSQDDLVVTTDKAEATFVLTPQISDLYINSPDFAAASANQKSYAKEIGHATITLALYDAQSSDLLLKVKDKGHIRSNAIGLERINRAVNAHYFKSRMNRWASHFSKYLVSQR